MTILQSINASIVSSLKSNNKEDTTALKNIKAFLENAILELKDPSEESQQNSLLKFLKTRNKTIATYKDALENASDVQKESIENLVKAEELELKWCKSFLPEELQNQKELSEDEIKEKLKSLISENSITSMKEMGKLMGLAKKSLGDMVDMKVVGKLAKDLL